MSSLPRAVVEAERRAEEIYQSLQATQQPETQPEPDPQIPDGGEAAPENVPVQEATPQSEEDRTWESRYKSLIGKYNAEVPRMASENKELRQQLDSVKREIDQLKAAPKQSLVKPEEVAEYGENLVDLIRRAAREEVTAKDREIAELKSRLDNHETVTVQSRTDSFYKTLTDRVPDWVELNENPAFLAWLNEYDEFAGRSRQALLHDAEQALDAIRVAKFFETWKKTQTNRQQQTNRSLEAQAVPDGSQTVSPPAAKKIWTRNEVAGFYASVRDGRINDQQAAAIEADINAAISEGRIR